MLRMPYVWPQGIHNTLQQQQPSTTTQNFAIACDIDKILAHNNQQNKTKQQKKHHQPKHHLL